MTRSQFIVSEEKGSQTILTCLLFKYTLEVSRETLRNFIILIKKDVCKKG